MHQNIDEAEALAAEQRLRAIARIFAAGILRLRSRFALPAATGLATAPRNLPDSAPNSLEVPGDTRLNVHSG